MAARATRAVARSAATATVAVAARRRLAFGPHVDGEKRAQGREGGQEVLGEWEGCRRVEGAEGSDGGVRTQRGGQG
eukprot:4607079-Prymnesium_polylepis.1